MIVVDYSQTIIASLMEQLKGSDTNEINVPLIRHMVVNSVRNYHTKFKDEYGEMVIACDSKKKYWRKQFFPQYKFHRKKARENSKYDWNLIFNTINKLKDELKEVFPYKVIEIECCEADDIIATLAKHSQNTGEPFLIISGDHDFFQLQKYPNVKQYSFTQNRFVTFNNSVDRVLFEHIIKGDRGDGIPNVLSSDDVIVNGVRQKPIQTKKLNLWFEDKNTMPSDIYFKRNFDRNKKLIDLSEIPEEYEKEIINSYNNYEQNDRSKIMNYFTEHKMSKMADLIEEF